VLQLAVPNIVGLCQFRFHSEFLCRKRVERRLFLFIVVGLWTRDRGAFVYPSVLLLQT
jgi:hypothetical protein